MHEVEDCLVALLPRPEVEIFKALHTTLTSAFLPIDFSKSINDTLQISFSLGLVKLDTSLKVFGSFKLTLR